MGLLNGNAFLLRGFTICYLDQQEEENRAGGQQRDALRKKFIKSCIVRPAVCRVDIAGRYTYIDLLLVPPLWNLAGLNVRSLKQLVCNALLHRTGIYRGYTGVVL